MGNRRKRVAVALEVRLKRQRADCVVIPNASPTCDQVRRCWVRASRTRSPQRSLAASSTRAIKSAEASGHPRDADAERSILAAPRRRRAAPRQ
jgi:Herpes virus proteins UL24 and UL76